MFAICIVLRVWSKFGKSSTRPLALTIRPDHQHAAPEPQLLAGVELARRHVLLAEQAAEVADPVQVVAAPELSRTKVKNSSSDADEEQRPDEVVQVLGEDREPREQRVADQRQQHVLAEQDDQPGDARAMTKLTPSSSGCALARREAPDHAAGRRLVQLDRAPSRSRTRAIDERPPARAPSRRRPTPRRCAAPATSGPPAGSARSSRGPGCCVNCGAPERDFRQTGWLLSGCVSCRCCCCARVVGIGGVGRRAIATAARLRRLRMRRDA